MAVTAKWYGNGVKACVTGDVVWKASGGSPVKCALLANTYTPDQDAHDFFDDVVAHQISGTGYTAGGVSLTLSDPTYDAASNEVRMDATDASWTTATITARYAVIYKATGVNSTSTLIGYVDFGEDVSATAGTFTIQWNASGVCKITAA